MHNSVKTFRSVTSIMTQLGSGAITSQIIRNNVQPTGRITAVTIPVASFFLGGLVAHAASKHAEQFITEINDAAEKAVEEIKSI